MSKTAFALLLMVVAIICAVIGYMVKTDEFPTGSGGTLLLRDELIRMTER